MKYKYPFTNHIVFAMVMRDPKLCRGLLQRIFPDREIREMKVRGKTTETEATILAGAEAHNVRLDVLFMDEDVWYDIEMQTTNEKGLIERAGYYHSIMSVEQLGRGRKYEKKPASYVIFLCCFDPFKMGEAKYCFSMYDPSLDLSAGEKRYTIILNSKADETKTPDHLRELFRYMNETSITGEDNLLRDIDEAVGNCNTPEGERIIMTFEQELEFKFREGHRQGLEEGIAQGLEEGMAQGIEKGRAEITIRTAHAMKSEGIPIAVIAKCTGLTADQIERL